MISLGRRTRWIGAGAALAWSLGCVTGRGASKPPVANRDWPQTLAEAEVAAGEHHYADADRLLAEYAQAYPGSEGAVESAYWRGLLALDPDNHDGSPQTAAALFETYENGLGSRPHRLEADLLRHVAQRLAMTSPPTLASTAPQPALAPDRTADLKAKDTEIQKLKDELAKANDELDRIKKRLTAPTKP